MAEVSFFSKYEEKENRVTNYTLLIFKQIYNESPYLFQEFIVDLISDECENIKVGVDFLQQKCKKGNRNSVIDGIIKQAPFQIFIETKLYDWFYNDQLEKHIENLLKETGQKVFIALANFDGKKDEHNKFKELKNRYKNEKDLIIKNIEFESLVKSFEKIIENIKSEILSTMIKEYEQFLNEMDLLPTWKYRLDVVNCAKSKDGVIENSVYLCPEAKGAYRHARAKYFGIYDNKKVDCIAEIKAVCEAEYNKETNSHTIQISWFDDSITTEKEIIEEAEMKSKLCWDDNVQMFLLTNFKTNINFHKMTKGGMFGSKKYFNFDSSVKDINTLENLIKNKTWEEFR